MRIIKEEDLLSDSTHFSVRTQKNVVLNCLPQSYKRPALSKRKKKKNQLFSEQKLDAVKIIAGQQMVGTEHERLNRTRGHGLSRM